MAKFNQYIPIRMPTQLVAQIDNYARAQKLTRSAVIREALTKHLQTKEKRPNDKPKK